MLVVVIKPRNKIRKLASICCLGAFVVACVFLEK
jgi:hypothetical protein